MPSRQWTEKIKDIADFPALRFNPQVHSDPHLNLLKWKVPRARTWSSPLVPTHPGIWRNGSRGQVFSTLGRSVLAPSPAITAFYFHSLHRNCIATDLLWTSNWRAQINPRHLFGCNSEKRAERKRKRTFGSNNNTEATQAVPQKVSNCLLVIALDPTICNRSGTWFAKPLPSSIN